MNEVLEILGVAKNDIRAAKIKNCRESEMLDTALTAILKSEVMLKNACDCNTEVEDDIGYICRDINGIYFIGDEPLEIGTTVKVLPLDGHDWVESVVDYSITKGYHLLEYPNLDIYGLAGRIVS